MYLFDILMSVVQQHVTVDVYVTTHLPLAASWIKPSLFDTTVELVCYNTIFSITEAALMLNQIFQHEDFQVTLINLLHNV